MKKQGLVFVIMAMLFVFPAKSFAILDYDAGSLETMISNHKKVRTVLGIRAAAEMGCWKPIKPFPNLPLASRRAARLSTAIKDASTSST